jgi:hypothetical protein
MRVYFYKTKGRDFSAYSSGIGKITARMSVGPTIFWMRKSIVKKLTKKIETLFKSVIVHCDKVSTAYDIYFNEPAYNMSIEFTDRADEAHFILWSDNGVDV